MRLMKIILICTKNLMRNSTIYTIRSMKAMMIISMTCSIMKSPKNMMKLTQSTTSSIMKRRMSMRCIIPSM